MSNETKTRAALVEAAKTFLTAAQSIQTESELFEGLPVITTEAVAWENRNFSPGTFNLWASVFYAPNPSVGRTVGRGGIDEINGFLQIDFNAAPDTGEARFIEWENKGRIFFHTGRFFLSQGHSVIVTGSGMSQGRHVENYYRKSFTVNFKSYLKRQQVTN